MSIVDEHRGFFGFGFVAFFLRFLCKSNCYPAADYLRDKIASPGQASEYSWDNIEQSVGNLADKILAQLC